MPNRTHKRKRRLPFEHRFDVVMMQPGLCNTNGGQTMLFADSRQPCGFTYRILRIPFCFDIAEPTTLKPSVSRRNSAGR